MNAQSEPPHATYPEKLSVSRADEVTLSFLTNTEAQVVAEIGVYKGHTATEIAQYLGNAGELHLFDFSDRVEEVVNHLRSLGYTNVIPHGNSYRLLDSYNWSLMRLLEAHKEPIFDYVFLDGAHVWAHDALAFCLVDRLLKPGGYIDFDDYRWSLGRSATLNPNVYPLTAELYTEEQIAERQVALIVNLLVRRDPRYKEVVKDKIFQKLPRSEFGGAELVEARSSNLPKLGANASAQQLLSANELVLFQTAVKGKTCAVGFGTRGTTFLLIEAEIDRIVSVDSDERWIRKVVDHPVVASYVDSGRLVARHVDIGRTKKWGYPSDDQRKSDWHHYWTEPWRHVDPSSVDLVVIGGRFRVACGLNALRQGNRDMTIVVHDFWPRAEYHVMLKYMDCTARADSLAVLIPKPTIDREELRADLERYAFAPR